MKALPARMGCAGGVQTERAHSSPRAGVGLGSPDCPEQQPQQAG